MPFPLSKLTELSAALGARYPGIKADILFLYFGETTSILYDGDVAPHVKINRVNWPRCPAMWAGEDSEWERLLVRYGVL